MPPYAGPSTAARSGEVADTLRLMAYLALALVLIVLDHRGGWLNQARKQTATIVAPLWAIAGWPGRLVERVSDDAGTLSQLTEENRRLRNEALINQARMARLQSVAADNLRLRGLLEAAERGNLDVVLAPILDIDLDPTRQRLVLDAGSRDKVRVGQSVIDAGGLLGQITGITPLHASVLLITDPSHAVPVAVARNGVRLVVYGEGRSDSLMLRSVPLSSDVRVGDVLVTSGLGGRFPPGFPVGTITALRPDDSRAFLVGEVKPAAQLDRGREVLVLLSIPPPPADTNQFDTQPAMPEGPSASSPAAQAAAENAASAAAAAKKPKPHSNTRPDDAPAPASRAFVSTAGNDGDTGDTGDSAASRAAAARPARTAPAAPQQKPAATTDGSRR
ncbi:MULTISPECIES: rod shape-determining protein MreC [Lysobacter]|uniref:Cell shape-determining protein MreC n=2 Tax=Lysobacter gummosus TaxID=262324 RepID=A0ABY3X8F0_9GAMM|nr:MULTISPECIES: rod shape-determining protein MreC [Lysobacter]ALN93396.1 rod shape-determining protein MreC [Lysobacter gummosus]UJB19896.1 rod shape-determining protein MreC [Lysobacter capsici]UJQ26378.1 rod shape-determining protein MreC [Lysobacter gummosus]UNP28863.1 rod shape-determining protein MreC [Lysobacter gummosus]